MKLKFPFYLFLKILTIDFVSKFHSCLAKTYANLVNAASVVISEPQITPASANI